MSVPAEDLIAVLESLAALHAVLAEIAAALARIERRLGLADAA